jgi:hypothetical protein
MKISRQSSPVQTIVDQKRLGNTECEYLNYLGSVKRYAREIKFRMAMEKVAFNKKKTIFTSKLDSNLRKKLLKCYIWSTIIVSTLGHF